MAQMFTKRLGSMLIAFGVMLVAGSMGTHGWRELEIFGAIFIGLELRRFGQD